MRLLHTDTRIAEIGQACGFSDQSAFARQFKYRGHGAALPGHRALNWARQPAGGWQPRQW